jgi:hypothetical protein
MIILPIRQTQQQLPFLTQQAKSSEDNETIMDRELKSESKTKFKRMTPTSNLKIDSSAYSISVEVTDPKGIKKVWIEIKYENEKYASHRATKSGDIYERSVINLQEGTYMEGNSSEQEEQENEIQRNFLFRYPYVVLLLTTKMEGLFEIYYK